MFTAVVFPLNAVFQHASQYYLCDPTVSCKYYFMIYPLIAFTE